MGVPSTFSSRTTIARPLASWPVTTVRTFILCLLRVSCSWSRSSAHGRNGRDPAIDQEVRPDDVCRIVRREVNGQLRDFQRIGDPLAWIVGSEDALYRVALLFAGEAAEHRRIRRAWA